MCGIVGYIGYEQAAPLLLKGLKTLEYRGYDSAGIAVIENSEINLLKSKGRLEVLSGITDNGKKLQGHVGIGHTRWATHGEPSDLNSHPHMSGSGRFAVVHNGIIENYMTIKQNVVKKGVKFKSGTDTEVIAQLLDNYYNLNSDVTDCIFKVLADIQGAYALGIICKDQPDKIFAVKKDNPLIVGKGQGENFIASDVTAILSKTRDIYRLGDEEVAIITRDSIEFFDKDRNKIKKQLCHIDWDITSAKKDGYDHFMLKEIMEQPKALRDTVNPRLDGNKIVLDGIVLTKEEIENFNKIYIVACGSAYHVGIAAKYIFEQLVRIPVEVDLGSEFRYRNPLVDKNTLVLIISQSGETADTLAALREAKMHGARVISIVNVVGSTITCESDDVLYTWAGPEIAVATTKAYSTQLSVIYLLALYIAKQISSITDDMYNKYLKELTALPDKIDSILKNQDKIKEIASKYFNKKSVFFIGRGLDYATSLEGSLKLKEISYINSEAYAAGELKHGTISLIEEGTLVIAIATQDKLFEKLASNIKEVKARGAVVLGITTEKYKNIEELADEVLYVPDSLDIFLPSLSVVGLQLFAYYVAYFKGCDIDKPKNLAKSVTVE